jgi:FtsH-binding integral membrane protein
MSQYPQYPQSSRSIPYASAGTDSAIVARFMNGVYAWMCVGLLVTAICAWTAAHNEGMLRFVGQSYIFLILAVFGLVLVISAGINKLAPAVATALFVLYAALNGLMLCGIFLRYDPGTVGMAFLITGGMFGTMSVIGMVTRKDLSTLGSICFMALIGLILASIVNIFMQNSALYWLVTYAGVLIFCGLTAYDTQKLKAIAYQTAGDETMIARYTIFGALDLYLDFINLLLFILRILGSKRR